MSDSTFAVVFSGELVPGADSARVQANFAQLFKVDAARVAPMFSGTPMTIKKGVDEATAKKYQQALLQAGAVSQVVNLAAPPPSAASAAPATPEPAATPSGGLTATLAEPGVLIKEPEQVTALEVDTSHLSLGAAGETIVEPAAVEELQVDLSTLSMAEPGVQLVPPSTVEVPQIDTSKLTMAEAGVVLKEPEKVEPAQIDTSKITLA